MPELRLVVLALQERLAFGPTFDVAMRPLFAGEPSSLSAATAPAEPERNAPTPPSARWSRISTGLADSGFLIADIRTPPDH
jgi:hypothetical protein